MDINTEGAVIEEATRRIATQLPIAGLSRIAVCSRNYRPSDVADAAISTNAGRIGIDIAIALASGHATGLPPRPLDAGLPGATDTFQGAFSAAAELFGDDPLTEPQGDGALELFIHPGAAMFEIFNENGAVCAWIAVKTDTQRPGKGGTDPERANLSRIQNIEMALTVEIGRARMPVRDVLGLEPGTVVELDRSAGAPADILLNGRLIARGEVVVVDREYGVRFVEILEPFDGHN